MKRSRPRRRTATEKERSDAWHDGVLALPEPTLMSVEDDPGRSFVIVRCHHIVLQQVLRRRAQELELPPHLLLWDLRVGMKVSDRRHERHHSPGRLEPILRASLPGRVFEFCDEFGLTVWLDRHYPE